MAGALRRSRVLLALALLVAAGAGADEWLVYVAGGIESIEGPWTERSSDVMFKRRGGTLVSVPYEDVDLAASTFITWQLNGRRRVPPRADLPRPSDAEPGPGSEPCVEARIVAMHGGETLDVVHGGAKERVHAACLDAPETEHRFVELGWFGRAMVSAVQLELRPGDRVCMSEQSPPLADAEGHRIVHLRLEGGQDYTREVIAGGLGLLRPAGCDRAVEYRNLEDRAIAEGRGLWGVMAERPALAAANLAVSVAGLPGKVAPPRGSGGG